MSRLFIAIPLAICVTGCRTLTPPLDARVYMPPTLSLDELVDSVNANNARIETLWARGYFDATIIEEPGGSASYLNGEVIVLHQKPDKLRILLNKDVAGTVFDLGTNGDKFWTWLPTENLVYIGTLANVDPAAAAALPLRPDLILQVLGVNVLATDLLAQPAPVLEFDPDGRLYMVRFIEPASEGPARLKVSKQVWYDLPVDGESPLPRKVILSDDTGRPVLRANLSRHRAVEGDDGPMVATQFELFLPETGTTMLMRLDETTYRRSGRRGSSPNAATFQFDPTTVGASEIRSLDRPSP